MFDLRMLSDVAPILDLQIGIGALLGSIVIANLLVIPALASRDRPGARLLLTASAAGILGLVLVLGFHPPSLFRAVGGYVVLFAALGFGVTRNPLGWRQALGRISVGSIVMTATLVVALWITVAPR